jgi:5'-nucleotidase
VGHEFKHYATARRVARDLVERLARAPFGAPVLLNVNVPDVPYDAITGYEVHGLGRRHKAQPWSPGKNPRGETGVLGGPGGAAREAGPGTDFQRARARRGLDHAAAGRPHARRPDPARGEWVAKP